MMTKNYKKKTNPKFVNQVLVNILLNLLWKILTTFLAMRGVKRGLFFLISR